MPRMSAVSCAIAFLFVLNAGCGGGDETLSVKQVTPSAGPYWGGESVTIVGTAFQKGGAKSVDVYFGNKKARVRRFDGDTRLIVDPPAGKVGEEVDVMVIFGAEGRATLPKAYKYIEPTAAKVEDMVDKKK